MRVFHVAVLGCSLVLAAPVAAQMAPSGTATVSIDTTDRIKARTRERRQLAQELDDVIRLKNIVPADSPDLAHYERREQELVSRIAALDSAGVAKPEKAKKAVSEGEVMGMIVGAVLGLFIAAEINE